MGRALQPPAAILRLVTRGVEAAWAPGTVEERKRRLVRTRRFQAIGVAAYVVFSFTSLLWHDRYMTVVFLTIALLNACTFYGSVRALRKLEKSS